MKWMWPVLAVYATLCLIYHTATPLLEASDEARHVAVAVYIAENDALPIAGSEQARLASQEATQTPLYYSLISLIMRPFDLSSAEHFFHMIPGSPIGRADLPGSRRMFYSPSNADTSALSFARAVRLGRIFSAGLVGIGIVILMQVAHDITRNKLISLWAGSLLALNPMVLFIGNSVNNDTMVILCSSFFIWLLTRYSRRHLSLTDGCILGAATGIAVLSKLSCAIFVPVVAYFIFYSCRWSWKFIKIGAASSSTFLLVAGWWFIRNKILYGEWTASKIHSAIIGNAREEVIPLAILYEWHGFIKSFWGVFGGFNIIYPNWIYSSLYALSGIMILLTLWAFITKPTLIMSLCCFLVILNLGAVAWWTSHLLGSQGRLLYPSVAAIILLPAIGLHKTTKTLGLIIGLISISFLLAIALWAGLILIPNSYI